MAQSQTREISIPNSPEERVRDQFVKQWEDDNCDDHIYTVSRPRAPTASRRWR